MADAKTELQVVISAKDEASATLKKTGASLSDISKAAGVAGIAIFGALGLMAKSAIDADAQMSKVTSILKQVGDSSGKAAEAINKASQAAVKLGFDDEDAAVSVANLYQITGDLTKAQELNGLAMDLARRKGISLDTASKAISMTLAGNTKVMKEYGIEMSDTATPMENLTLLQDKLKGSASDFANTTAGKMEVLKITIANLSETVGGVLIPVFNQVLASVTPFIDKISVWAQQNPEMLSMIVKIAAGIGALMLAIGIITPVITALSFAWGILVTVAGAFGTVLAFIAANPVILIIAAIVALALGIYELVKHWDIVSAKIKEIWDGLSDNAKNWIIVIGTILTGGILALVIKIVQNWDMLRDKTKAAWEAIKAFMKPIIDWIGGEIQKLISWVDNLISKLAQIGKVVGGAMGKVGGAVNSVVGGIANFITGKKANGGNVNAGGSYLVGERGAEIFTPSQSGKIIPNGAGGGGGLTVVIQGNSFMGESDMAVRVGDMIVNRLKLSAKLGL